MKNYYLILALAFSFWSNAQCIITGPSTFNVGQTVSYSIPALAQCSECYDWDINGSDSATAGNVSIVGSDQNNSVSILGLSAGSFSIKVTYFDETGCHECILSGTTAAPICCTPNIKVTGVICRGDGDGVGGFVRILSPSSCKMDVSVISKIELTLSSGWVFNPSGDPSLAGLNSGTITNPNIPYYNSSTNEFFFEVYNPDCVYGQSVTCQAKIYYNNGCSMKIVSATGTNTTTPPPASLAKNQENNNKSKIEFFPNPANSKIKFSGENIEKYTVGIYNSVGFEVVKKTNASNEINIENLVKGIYVYKIFNNGRVIKEGKIVKE